MSNFKILLETAINSNEADLNRQIESISKKLDGLPLKIKIDKQDISNLEFTINQFKKMQQSRLDLINTKDIDKVKELNSRIKELSTSTPNAKREMVDLRNSITILGRESRNVSSDLSKFTKYFSMYEVFSLTKRGVLELSSAVVDYDKNMTELRKVTSLTENELNKFYDTAINVARDVGRTTSDVLAASSEWARAGYDESELATLSEVSLLTTNIADGISSVEEATSYLIAAMKAYNVESSKSLDISSAINAVSNQNAVGYQELANGLSRVASVFSQGSTSMAETLGLLSGGFEISRNMEKTASGLQTISTRLRSVQLEGEETVVPMAKLQEQMKSLTGVDIVDPLTKELRGTYDILADLASKWDQLDSMTQESVAFMAAGTRQKNVFLNIMTNFKNVEKAAEDAKYSMSSATDENKAFMSSIEGLSNQLKTSIEVMANNSISSDTIKSILKMSNTIIKIIDDVGLLNVGLIGVAGTLAIIGNVKKVDYLTSLPALLTSITGGVSTLTSALMSNPLFLGTVGIVAAIKIFDALNVSVSEQTQKVSDLTDEYNKLSSEIDSLKTASNPSEADLQVLKYKEMELEATRQLIEAEKELLMQKEILGKGVFGSGLIGSVDKDLDNIDLVISAISNVKAQLEDMNANPEQFEASEIKYLSEHLSKLQSDLSGVVPELTSAYAKLTDALAYASEEEKVQIQSKIDALDAILPLIDAEVGLTDKVNETAIAVSNQTDSIDGAVDSIESLSSALEELESVADDTIDNVYLLDETMRKLSEGKVLTGKEIDNLCKKFPELIDKVTETNGVYGIEIDVLEDLRTQSINTANDMAESQKIQTQNAINQAKSRIQSYKSEILALSQLGQAILTTGRTLQSVADIDSRDMESMTGLEKSSLFGSLENDSRIKAEKENIKQLEESLKAIENLENRIEYATSNSKYANGLNSNNKSSSGSSKSSASNIAKDIKDKLQSELDKIQKPRLELDYEIDILNAKLDTATLKNDQKSIEIINKQLADLLNKRKELTATQNVELGSLKTKFTDETSLKEINGLMEDNSKEWWKDLNNIIQKNIDVINSQKDAFDKQLSKYDLDIEQQQSKLSILQLQNGEVNEQVDLYKSLSSSYLEQQYYIEESLKNMYSQRSTLNESSKEYELITQNILDYENKLVDAMKSQADVKSDLIDLAHEQMEIELEKAIYGSSGKDEWKKDNDDKIQALQDELYLIESQAAAKKKKEEAEKRELELQQLKDKLANLRNQKTQQEYRKQADGSYQWEYVADKQAIADVEKEIADKQVEIEKAAEEQKLEDKKQSIQNQISQLQNLEKAKEESYTRSLEDLKLAMENEKFAWTLNGEEVSGIVETALTNVSGIYDVKMSDILSNVQSKLDSIRDAFDSAMNMANNMPSGGSSSGGDSGSSNTNVSDGKYVDSNGKVFHVSEGGDKIYVSRPDGTSSTVSKGDPMYDKTVDALEDTLSSQGKKYANGGLVSHTGLAWVDGTKSNPERMLSASENKAYEIGMKNIPLFNETMQALFDLATPQVSRLKTPTINPTSPNVSFGDINLPNVKDARGFANEVREVVNDMFSGLSNQAKLIPVN